MKKIDHKDVPYGFMHCINADCLMAEHCLRQMAMQALPKDEMSVRIVNPQIVVPSEKCKFFRSDEPQVYGRGFTNMQKQMLPGQYDTFRYRLQGKFGRNPLVRGLESFRQRVIIPQPNYGSWGILRDTVR